MLLGKRTRSRIRRTTSMTELSTDDLTAVAGDEAQAPRLVSLYEERRRVPGTSGPPRSIQRRSFSDFRAVQSTAQFLMVCGHCRTALGAGIDTFIYRGEIAFCSLECRQHQMNQDELREKSRLASVQTEPANTSSKGTGKGEAAVAA